ncbi:hypothetical protein ACFL6I_03155 [candidate division KSB1 bacterium]
MKRLSILTAALALIMLLSGCHTVYVRHYPGAVLVKKKRVYTEDRRYEEEYGDYEEYEEYEDAEAYEEGGIAEEEIVIVESQPLWYPAAPYYYYTGALPYYWYDPWYWEPGFSMHIGIWPPGFSFSIGYHFGYHAYPVHWGGYYNPFYHSAYFGYYPAPVYYGYYEPFYRNPVSRYRYKNSEPYLASDYRYKRNPLAAHRSTAAVTDRAAGITAVRKKSSAGDRTSRVRQVSETGGEKAVTQSRPRNETSALRNPVGAKRQAEKSAGTTATRTQRTAPERNPASTTGKRSSTVTSRPESRTRARSTSGTRSATKNSRIVKKPARNTRQLPSKIKTPVIKKNSGSRTTSGIRSFGSVISKIGKAINKAAPAVRRPSNSSRSMKPRAGSRPVRKPVAPPRKTVVRKKKGGN